MDVDLNLPRYKFVVSVYLGEMRGEGVQYRYLHSYSKMSLHVSLYHKSVGTRCFWDRDTDQVAQDTFLNVFFNDAQ